MEKFSTYHIHMSGIVQGVGFRPAVYLLAQSSGWCGYVCNSSDGLHIEVNCSPSEINNIVGSILHKAPSLSKVISHNYVEKTFVAYNSFSIRYSDKLLQPDLFLTPDFAMCSECRAEMQDSSNRRYRYPFITCTQCGPRFSIIHALPYDRENTTMRDFTMCERCQAEYADIKNRRYYSQTNSCGQCGVQLTAYGHDGDIHSTGNQKVLKNIQQWLGIGKIVAVKGIGGYLLLCNAANATAINTLRLRKARPAKPFALLCRDIAEVKKIAECTPGDEALLQSAEAPVVLLQANPEADKFIAIQAVAPGLTTLGIMLPSNPLLDLIVHDFNSPLVATSANISGAPIIYKDDDALAQLPHIADFIVTHNRDILIPQDDSVVRTINQPGKKIIIRRARGMAPGYFQSLPLAVAQPVFAAGAMMKSSITFAAGNNIYVSQYLGNTESLEGQLSYNNTVAHFNNLLQKMPGIVLHDKHAGYYASIYAATYAHDNHANLCAVQHHKAHFAAVLAENNLTQDTGKIAGITWDGTGLGDDGEIWGGEFMVYHQGCIKRKSNCSCFPVLLGDKMAREPRLSALSICRNIAKAQKLLEHRFTNTAYRLYNHMLVNHTGIVTSSIGRLFDAAASILNLCDVQSFEGQAAMLLENCAQSWLNSCAGFTGETYLDSVVWDKELPADTICAGMVDDVLAGREAGFIAARFHLTLVKAVEQFAEKQGCRKIAFSGGVFQNALLVNLLSKQLNPNYQLFFHHQLSPNDENISFGQIVYYAEDFDGCRTKRADIKEMA